jgi:uncharacterized membrane protein
MRTKIAWGLLVTGAVVMALAGIRYYLGPQVYFPRQREVYEVHTLGLMTHISAMVFAVLVGPFQFFRTMRERWFRFHRVLGRVYIVAALIGGLGGIYMAPFAASGAVSAVSFTLLGAGVLLTTSLAYVRIRAGNVQSHREWMTRSYALIFAAVTLRIYMPFLEAGFGEYVGYAIVAWACWVPNLMFAEWFIRSRLRRHPEPPRVLEPSVGSPAPA